MISIYVLLALMILAAIIAVEIRDLLSSVIAVGAVGLLLSLVSLLLKAPDVAITQLTVELIAVIVLIRATVHRDVAHRVVKTQIFPAVVAFIFAGVFLTLVWWSLAETPAFGEPIMRVASRYTANGVSETGAANVVASVLLDYRGYDTLAEATVLFAAAMGVLAVTRRSAQRRDREERRYE